VAIFGNTLLLENGALLTNETIVFLSIEVIWSRLNSWKWTHFAQKKILYQNTDFWKKHVLFWLTKIGCDTSSIIPAVLDVEYGCAYLNYLFWKCFCHSVEICGAHLFRWLIVLGSPLSVGRHLATIYLWPFRLGHALFLVILLFLLLMWQMLFRLSLLLKIKHFIFLWYSIHRTNRIQQKVIILLVYASNYTIEKSMTQSHMLYVCCHLFIFDLLI
jgi:hypothetical protein